MYINEIKYCQKKDSLIKLKEKIFRQKDKSLALTFDTKLASVKKDLVTANYEVQLFKTDNTTKYQDFNVTKTILVV